MNFDAVGRDSEGRMHMKVYPDEFTCSYCGELWPDEKVDICPECGAVMDADTGNEKGE